MKKFLFFIIIISLTIYSCQQQKNLESKEAFEKYMTLLKNGVITGENEDEFFHIKHSSMDIFYDVFRSINYTIIEVKEEQNKAEIKITLTVPNLEKEKENIFTQIETSNEDFQLKLKQTITNTMKKNTEKITQTTTIYLEKKNEKWMLVDNEKNYEFLNLLTGNFISLNQTE